MIPAVHPEKRFSSSNKTIAQDPFDSRRVPENAPRPSVKPRNQALTLSYLSPTKQNPPPFPHGSDLELLTRNMPVLVNAIMALLPSIPQSTLSLEIHYTDPSRELVGQKRLLSLVFRLFE